MALIAASDTHMEGDALVWRETASPDGPTHRSTHPDGVTVLLGRQPQVWYNASEPQKAVCVSDNHPITVSGVIPGTPSCTAHHVPTPAVAMAVPLLVGYSTALLTK